MNHVDSSENTRLQFEVWQLFEAADLGVLR